MICGEDNNNVIHLTTTSPIDHKILNTKEWRLSWKD